MAVRRRIAALSTGGAALVLALAAHLATGPRGGLRAEPPTAPSSSSGSSSPADAAPGPTADSAATAPHRRVRGHIAWLAEALERRFGIPTDPDVAEAQIVLETDSGELVLVAKDARGRGFWLDPALRSREIELEVRQAAGSPVTQIIRVFSWHEGKFYELDYWCDICAIPMYELKSCECCQGPTRIRERLVDDPLVEWSDPGP